MRGEIYGLNHLAAQQHYVVGRRQVLESGLDDKYIGYQIGTGRWLRLHDGVYQVDFRPLERKGELMAAILACGPGSMVSHRAAMLLWGMDGIASAPVELTVPFNNHPIPDGVIVHRTRRKRHRAEQAGLPITTPERTLLDAASCLPRVVVAKALDSAIRKNLTTVDSVYDTLANKGGRGVKGTRSLRWVVRERIHDTATDSGSEFDLLYHMQMAFLPRPEVQYPLATASGRRVPDFYWPALNKAVEVDGLDAHASADKLDDDLKRQNELMDLGIELRRFSAREIRRNPDGVVSQIRQFLES